MSLVTTSLTYFGDPDKGRPLFDAQIYVGEPDTDPSLPLNQKQVSLRLENGTTVDVGQPVRTGPGGYVEYKGSYAILLVDGDFSLKVLDRRGRQKYYIPNNENLFQASQISISIGGIEANLQKYLNNRHVADYDALRALASTDPDEGIISGTVITVTDDLIGGDFVVLDGTVTDNNGTRIVFTDDPNKFAERRVHNSTVYSDWFQFTDGADEYQKIDAMLEYDILKFSQGIEYHYGSYNSSRILELTKEGQQIYLNGGTLAVPNNSINVMADHVTIDLGGGILSQHVRYAEIAVTTTISTSTITVVDPQYLDVGQDIASSWGDTASSNEYPIGGPTGNPKRKITNITGNVVTVDVPLSDPSLIGGSPTPVETVPDGVVFGEFLFVSFIQCFNDNMTIKNGSIQRCRGYYYRSPVGITNPGGRINFIDIDFASNALDQMLLKFDQKVYLTRCTMAKQWDYAKTGIWLDGNASVYIDNCRSLKMGNYDSAFNFRGTFAPITVGEISITDSVIDGEQELPSPPANSFGVNVLYIFEFAAGMTFGRVRCSNTRFTNFTRHLLSPGAVVKTHQTVINSIQFSDCNVNASFGNFVYSGVGNGIICPNVQVSNTSFNQDAIYEFHVLSNISGATSSFVPEFSDCYFKITQAGFCRFDGPSIVRNSRFNLCPITVSSQNVQFDNCILENGTTITVDPSFDARFGQFMGTFIIDDPSFPENPENIFTVFGGTAGSGLRFAQAKSVDGSFLYDVFKAGAGYFCSTNAYKTNTFYYYMYDDYFIPRGSLIRDIYTGLLERVSFNLKTELAAAAPSGSTSIVVNDATGIVIGDKINVLLDDNIVDTVDVDAAYGGGTTIPLTGALTGDAALGQNINIFRVVAI